MFSLRDAIDHPAANGPEDDPMDAKIERWMEDHADEFGVFLFQAKCPKTKRMGWKANAMQDGEPFGKDTEWHDTIAGAANDGERLMDKAIEAAAAKACRD